MAAGVTDLDDPKAEDRPSGGFRVTLGTVMLLVLATASLSALAGQLGRMVGTAEAVHYAVSAVLCVVLFGSAIGMALRLSPAWIMLQVALAAIFLLMVLWLVAEELVGWGGNYAFLIGFAGLVVVPLALTRYVAEGMAPGPRRGRIKRVARVVLAASATEMAVVVYFCICEFFV